MSMGLERATSRSDRPLSVLLLCELEKANGQVQQRQITLNSALRAFRPSVATWSLYVVFGGFRLDKYRVYMTIHPYLHNQVSSL
jgi:hypothetical protein